MRTVACGEAMLELSPDGDRWQLGYGGDTLNTAIHMARAGIETAYLTALGSDQLSAGFRERWTAEGLDCSLVLAHPGRNTGLYAIATDANGERTFAYWRSESAAREMFAIEGAAAALDKASTTGLLLFSLISLAILPPEGRDVLIDLARSVREKGGRVAFDGNFRPQLWRSIDEARHWRDKAIALCDIGLPTLDDERRLGAGDGPAVTSHWQGLGCGETIVKLGAAGCLLPGGELIAPPAILDPVDTSGAGDAFNAGYLTARLRGAAIVDAARSGHHLAGWTIMRRGAIPCADQPDGSTPYLGTGTTTGNADSATRS